jgi:LmbE family N-acetylglucosaminyl deacetylase
MIRLAGVFAHPDDDIYLLGGQLLLHPDLQLSLLFATDGGAGPISDPSQATRETLGSVRRQEQHDALELVGFDGSPVEWLGHPDYYLPDVPLDVLVSEIEDFLVRHRPHVVVTFGPDGLTSHHDHKRVGAAAMQAFRRVRARSDDAAFQRLYYASLARSDVDRFYEGVSQEGFEYGEEGALFDITGVPDASIAVRVDIGSVQERKWNAILAHRTQMIEHMRIPEPLRFIYLDSECFVQAFPESPSTETRNDLFDDLDRGADSETGPHEEVAR